MTDCHLERKGLIFILSSPSGAGKTTIYKNILAQDKEIKPSISVTTRQPRPNEIDGQDYFFISRENFAKKLDNNDFIEYAEVFDNYYGTPREPVDRYLSEGIDILFDIDWQGTQQVQEKYPQDIVRVFILPPSIEILETRLKTRGTDSPDIIERRMQEALLGISHFAEYDYVIINDNLEKSIQDIYAILRAERLKRSRQKGIVEFVNQMRSK
jgi:guanylate kinase